MIQRAVFYDMLHSNNAARIRLWLAHNPQVRDQIETKMITYADLKNPAFARVNPLKKVPAFVRPNGAPVYESNVILNYLEHKYNNNTKFVPQNPEERMHMDFVIRLHDLYVSSPNSSMPGCSHTQGSMYLAPVPTPFCAPERCISRPDRAKKIQELWEQLERLNELIQGPYIVGSSPTLADFSWYPTTIFMEYCLPKVFGWPDVFRDEQYLPKVSEWWSMLTEQPEYSQVRHAIYNYFAEKHKQGQFATIEQEVQDPMYQWKFPVQWERPFPAILDYQEPPPPGKRVGRYISPSGTEPDVLVDEHVPKKVTMHDARTLDPPASLDQNGFTLSDFLSKLLTTSDDERIATSFPEDPDLNTVFLCKDKDRDIYYQEMKDLIRQESKCSQVYIFDHTVRQSVGATSLNATDGNSAAAPVLRVHCDYTATGAPRRFLQLATNLGLESGQVQEIIDSGRRYSFINVWRSIDTEHPVLQRPLAVCDAASVPKEDRFLYELHFPDRVGENYSLRFNPNHLWYTFSKMTHNECLVFKVFDSQEDTAQFVFHSSFDDPRGGFKAPPRQSIETRAIAVW